MRKQYSAAYKADIVQELLKEEKTVSQLASETGIHPTQLKEWKKVALTRLPELFRRNDQALDEARNHEQKVTELYLVLQPSAIAPGPRLSDAGRGLSVL